MDKNSRVKNSILNLSSTIGGQVITIVMQFLVRTVFIHTLGKPYLGINGLFSNILSMLSLAEMGIGSAIIFKLYDPIAKDNRTRISALMKFYKIVYRYIGIAILIIGLSLIPFLPYLIADYNKLASLNLNAVLIFVLYLLNSVSSYLFFAYKSAIIMANQKEYSINVIGYFATIIMSIVQIITLILFDNFVLFVFISIAKTVLQNLVVARMADRMYPYLKNGTDESISVAEMKDIFKDCGALFIYKVNNVVIKSTDNLVLSAMIGLEAIALYSNYYIFFAALASLVIKVYNSVGHSIGNLHTTNDVRKEYSIFEVMMLVAAVMGAVTFAGIFAVCDEFMETWIGRDWVIPQPFTFLMGLELFTMSFKFAIAKYRTAYGLFKQGWIRPLVSMLLNLIISLTTVRRLGIIGVLIGTVMSDWLTFVWYDPLVVHSIGFRKAYPVSRYYMKFAKYFVTTCVVGFIDYSICHSFFVGYGWASVVLHAILCGITASVVVMAVSANTDEAKYIFSLCQNWLRVLKKRIAK